VGVAIGLMVMIITVCVVLGFKHTIRDKVAGFGGHIQVQNLMKYNDIDPYTICAGDSMMQVFSQQAGVRHVQRYTITQGLLKTDDDFLGVMFKGVGPEFDRHFLAQNMVAGEIPAFSDSTSRYQLLMSKMIADKLHLNVGDKVFAYFIGDENVKTRKYTIAGIYQTNMTRFDEHLCFTDLYAANRLNGWDEGHCTGVEVSVEDLNYLAVTTDAFIDNINRTDDGHGNTMVCQTIYEIYPNIFNWLELLDINVWIILVLMVCVAGFTMISGLLIIILERTQMIGILKAQGMDNRTLRKVFLWVALFLTGKGILWGNLIGLAFCLVQWKWHIISLDPANYYLEWVPIHLTLPMFILINVGTIIITLLVLIGPSALVARIAPTKAIQSE
jgi:lipoprotein-releasing system permease protein